MACRYKKLSVVVIAFLMLSSLSMSGQYTVNQVKDNVVQALKTGDAETLTSFFNNPVDISLPYNDDSYSKKQASVIVSKFLLQYKVKNFEVKQSGTSSDGSVFVIGLYQATNGKLFRVYLLIKKQSQSAYIHLLEFEEE